MMRAALLALFAFGAATPLLADVPGRNWMPQHVVKERLQRMGYRYVTPLEADDGHWEGLAVHNNRIVEIHVDPRNGRVIREKPKR